MPSANRPAPESGTQPAAEPILGPLPLAEPLREHVRLGRLLWESPPTLVGGVGAQALSGLLLVLGIAALALGALERDWRQVVLWFALGIVALLLSMLPLLRAPRRSSLALYERGMLIGTHATLEVPYGEIVEVQEHADGGATMVDGPSSVHLRIRWGEHLLVIAPVGHRQLADAYVRDVAIVALLLRKLQVPFVRPLAEQQAPAAAGAPPTS